MQRFAEGAVQAHLGARSGKTPTHLRACGLHRKEGRYGLFNCSNDDTIAEICWASGVGARQWRELLPEVERYLVRAPDVAPPSSVMKSRRLN